MIKNLVTFAVMAVLNSTSVFASSNVSLPIVGGDLVESNDPLAAVTVGLYFTQLDGYSSKFCSGAILDNSRILTAAHCVEGAMKGVVIFKTRINFDQKASVKKEESRVMTGLSKSVDYLGAGATMSEYHDLGIVTFAGGLPFGYRPTKVISAYGFKQYLKTGTNAYIAGYGSTGSDRHDEGVLRKASVVVKGALSKGFNIVAGSPGKVGCHGDSGGPAFVWIEGDYYLWGAASRSDCATYTIYTKYVQLQDVNGNTQMDMEF